MRPDSRDVSDTQLDEPMICYCDVMPVATVCALSYLLVIVCYVLYVLLFATVVYCYVTYMMFVCCTLSSLLRARYRWYLSHSLVAARSPPRAAELSRGGSCMRNLLGWLGTRLAQITLT